MAITMDALEALIRECGFRYDRKETFFSLGFATSRYHSTSGERHCFVVVEPSENGEYLTVFAPLAFTAQGPHVSTMLQACMAIQWQTPMVQFEFNERTAEIRPVVEFPLEDAPLTARQLERCVKGLVTAIETYAPTLHRALHEGVIGFPTAGHIESDAAEMIAEEMQRSGDPDALEAATQLLAPDDATSKTAEPRIEPGGN